MTTKIILWIDDQPERFDIISKHIPPSTIVIFAYGFDQVKYSLTHIKYSLLIIDYDMPGLDGMQVITKFGFIFRDAPIILCSCNDREREDMCEELAHIGYTCRPAPAYRFDELIAAVHEGLNIQTNSWING